MFFMSKGTAVPGLKGLTDPFPLFGSAFTVSVTQVVRAVFNATGSFISGGQQVSVSGTFPPNQERPLSLPAPSSFTYNRSDPLETLSD